MQVLGLPVVGESGGEHGRHVCGHGQADQHSGEEDHPADNAQQRADPRAAAKSLGLYLLPGRDGGPVGPSGRGQDLHRAKLPLARPHEQGPALLVGELSDQDADEVDELTEAEKPERKQPEQPRADLAHVEPLQAVEAHEPAQAQQGRVKAFVRRNRDGRGAPVRHGVGRGGSGQAGEGLGAVVDRQRVDYLRGQRDARRHAGGKGHRTVHRGGETRAHSPGSQSPIHRDPPGAVAGDHLPPVQQEHHDANRPKRAGHTHVGMKPSLIDQGMADEGYQYGKNAHHSADSQPPRQRGAAA